MNLFLKKKCSGVHVTSKKAVRKDHRAHREAGTAASRPAPRPPHELRAQDPQSRGPAIPGSLTCRCWLRSRSPSRWPRRRNRPPPLPPPVRTGLRGARPGAHASLATRGPTSSRPREFQVEALRPQRQPAAPPAAPPFCQAGPRDPDGQLRLAEAAVARETEKLPGEDAEH